MSLDDTVGVLLGILYFGAIFGSALITVLKGKVRLAAVGVLIGGIFCWIPGAIRLAKPHSYWARRFYDEEKLARARERFSKEGHGQSGLGGQPPSAPMEA